MQAPPCLIVAVVALALCGGLAAACGKKSSLDPVPGGDYPRQYPGPDPVKPGE